MTDDPKIVQFPTDYVPPVPAADIQNKLDEILEELDILSRRVTQLTRALKKISERK